MYGLNNRAPKKWKRFTPLEQIMLDSKKRPEDEFSGMTPKEVKAWLKENDPEYSKYFGNG